MPSVLGVGNLISIALEDRPYGQEIRFRVWGEEFDGIPTIGDIITINFHSIIYSVQITSVTMASEPVYSEHMDQFGSRHTGEIIEQRIYFDIEGLVESMEELAEDTPIFIDTNDMEWVEAQPALPYSDSVQPLHLEVECKICKRKFPYDVSRIGIDFFLSPTDLIGVCVCRSCHLTPPSKWGLKDPPKDIVSVYHNRRKLRTRRRK